MTWLLVTGVVLSVFVIGWLIWRRRSQRLGVPTRVLEASDEVGEDLAYAYYVVDAEVRQLATSLNLSLPITTEQTDRSSVRAGVAHGPAGEDSLELTRSLGGEINLAALARDIRNSVGRERVADDVTLVPPADGGGRNVAQRATDQIANEKRASLRAVAEAHKLAVMRGRFQCLSVDNATGCMELELTHLSSEELEPETSHGFGNASAMNLPAGAGRARRPRVAGGMH